MRAGGQKDRHDETNSRFSQFCEKRLSIQRNVEFYSVYSGRGISANTFYPEYGAE